jgi:hypothetical protein
MSEVRLSARPSSRDITERDCIPWQEKPNINPRGNGDIGPVSQPYKTYQKNCFEIFIKNQFEGINPFDQLETRVKSGEFTTKESYEEEWGKLLGKIIPALNTPSTSIDDIVKAAYYKYITDAKNKIDKMIDKQLNPSVYRGRPSATASRTPNTPQATIAAPGIEQDLSPVARVLNFGSPSPQQNVIDIIRNQLSLSEPLINLINTLSTEEFKEDSLQPYLQEIYGRETLENLFYKKVESVEYVSGPIKKTIIEYIYNFYQNTIENEEYYEPNFNMEKFIEVLTDVIEIILLADRYFIRYDNYVDKYENSLLFIVNRFKHVYEDNFDYITSIKKAFRIFTALKLEKLANKVNPRADSRVYSFTKNEMDRCIYLIKIQMIYDLELDGFFDKPKIRQKLIQTLNVDEGAEVQEVYLYTLKFILYDVDYSPYAAITPKKLKYLDIIRPSIQKSNEVMKDEGEIKNIEPETILEKCKAMLSSINPYYNSYRLKIQAKCSVFSERCINLNEARKTIMDKYPIRIPEDTSDVSIEDVDIRGVVRKYALATLFKKWHSYVEPQDRKEFWLRYFNVVFKGEAGIFTGPGRELIQVCLQTIQDELEDLFIPVDSDSKKMIINPNFKPSPKFLEKANITEWNLEIKKDILQFIGGLFTRALLLNIDIPVSLSYYTLSYLYYKNNIEDDTYGFYYLIDMPNASNNYFKLMEMDPETLEYVDLHFNDVYPLSNNDELITKDNISKYINNIGKFILTRPDQPEYIQLLEAFYKGFLLKRSFLINNGISIKYLDKLLNESGGAISEKNLEKLIKHKLKFEFSKELEESALPEEKEKRLKLIKHQEQIKEWFIELLNTDGSDFPYEKLGFENPGTNELQTQFMLSNFLPKLLYFWTSSYNINLNEKMIINIYDSDVPNKLPSAHTCVKTIDIPSAYSSYNELFEKLATSVYNTQGFAFAGGVKHIVRKCMDSAIKKKTIEKDYNKAFQSSLKAIIKCHQRLTKSQQKKLIKYVENNAIDFKNAKKREISQWSKQLCKQVHKL